MYSVVVVGSLAFAALVAVSPASAEWLAAKEGPLEHLGHGVLVLAALAWVWAAVRRRRVRAERWVCIGLALTCGLVLGEELDWGAVYGLNGLSDVVRAVAGRGNLHNAWSGASYLLFALLPVGLVGVVGWRRGDAPGRLPRRRDALGLVLLGLLSVVATLVWEAGEEMVDEVGETLLYLSLGWMGVRPVGREVERSG